MIQKLVFPFLISLSVISCDVAPEYNVYVVNESGQDLRVSYKSMKHEDGPIEGTVHLKDGERDLIISTRNIKSGRGYIGTTREHCYLVADYVDAYTTDDLQSSLTWCSEDVHFEVEDIGQGVFTMTFSKEHF